MFHSKKEARWKFSTENYVEAIYPLFVDITYLLNLMRTGQECNRSMKNNICFSDGRDSHD